MSCALIDNDFISYFFFLFPLLNNFLATSSLNAIFCSFECVYTVEPLKTDTFGEWPSVRLREVPSFKINLKGYFDKNLTSCIRTA